MNSNKPYPEFTMLKKPTTTKRLLAYAFAMLAVPLVTYGQVTTYNYSTPVTLVSGSTTFNVPQYTGPGTLMEVELVLDMTSNPYVQAYNSNMIDSETFMKATGKIGYYQSASATLSFAGDTDAITVTSTPTTINVPNGSGTTVAPGATNKYYGPTQSSANFPQYFVPSADLSEFEGSGTTALTIDLLESIDKVSGSGGSPYIDFGTGNSLEGFLTVDYFYCDCVPEPSSLGLMALSLGALVLGRRFWLKRANNLS